MSKRSFYESYYYMYSSASPEGKAKSRSHWESVHKENLESGRDDLICFSSRILEMINLADGKLVIGCPKYFVDRVARNLGYYNLDLYDAFNEAIHTYCNKVNTGMQAAFLCGDYREYIPSAYLPEYLDFEKYPFASL